MTHSDLFCMAMESGIAYKNMEIICKALGVPYPPRADDKKLINLIDKDIDFSKGIQTPVSSAFN